MSALDSVRKAVKSRIGNMTDDLMDQEIRWALQEFMSFSQVWRHVENVTLVAAQTDYQLTPNISNPAVVAETLLAAWDAKFPLKVAVDLAVELSRPDAAEGVPARVELVGGTHLRLSPVPDSAAVVESGTVYALLTMTVDPTAPLVELPAPVTPFTDAIVSGALARLHAMDAKPWSNALLVRYHTARFHAMKATARAAAKAGRSDRGAPWRFPRFGA